MSNTLTNVKDIKVAQKALMPFTANLMPVTSFSTNFFFHRRSSLAPSPGHRMGVFV